MAKKRPTLDAFLNTQNTQTTSDGEIVSELNSKQPAKVNNKNKSSIQVKPVADKNEIVPASTASELKNKKPEVIRHMLYLPLPVYDQLQGLIFEEQRGQTKRRKTHDYLLDSIDLLFKKKGLKSISELLTRCEP